MDKEQRSLSLDAGGEAPASGLLLFFIAAYGHESALLSDALGLCRRVPVCVLGIKSTRDLIEAVRPSALTRIRFEHLTTVLASRAHHVGHHSIRRRLAHRFPLPPQDLQGTPCHSQIRCPFLSNLLVATYSRTRLAP